MEKQKPTSRFIQFLRSPYFLLTLLLLIIFIPITVIYLLHGDFFGYYALANIYFTAGTTTHPHFIYILLLNTVKSLIPFNVISFISPTFGSYLFNHAYPLAAFLIVIAAYLWLGYILYNRIKKSEIQGAVWITLSLMLVAPINLFTLPQHDLYLGYIGITVFHNPPMTLLKPVALLLFWGLVAGLSSNEVKLKEYIEIFFLSVLSVLIKPSYAICLLPASVVYVVYLALKRSKLNLKLYLISFVLPTVLILLYQYFYFYQVADARVQSGIAFAPLQAMLRYTPSALLLGFMFLMSIAFPLLTLILCFKDVKKENNLIFAWITFLVAAVYTYFLTETGSLAGDLNFEWSGEIALFVLFAETAIFIFKQYPLVLTKIRFMFKKLALYLVLALHVLGGIAWYLGELFQRKMWWGW
jgi:hypothetical protein